MFLYMQKKTISWVVCYLLRSLAQRGAWERISGWRWPATGSDVGTSPRSLSGGDGLSLQTGKTFIKNGVEEWELWECGKNTFKKEYLLIKGNLLILRMASFLCKKEQQKKHLLRMGKNTFCKNGERTHLIKLRKNIY